MAISKATLTQVNAAYSACYKLVRALQPYHQGDADPAQGTSGSLSFTDVDALVTAAKTAVDAVNSAA